MTAVASPPAPPPAAPSPRPADSPSRPAAADARAAPRFHIPAEAALAALTLATVFGFSRLFDSAEFWGPLFVVTVYSHVALLAMRRRGLGILVTAIIGTLGLYVVLAYTLYFNSLTYGLPAGSTLRALGDSLASSWETFQTAQPPAPVESGFLFAAAVAIFFAVFLADWAAFRLWSSWESLVPATTVFIFCSVLGATEHRTESVLAFLVTAIAFALLHRIARRETSAGWLAADAVRGANSWFRVGSTVGVVAVAIGALVAPNLPGASSGALFGRDDSQGKRDRFVVSPLVDIKAKMDQQADVEMFTVRADRESYWRLTALEMFDGETWRSKGRFVSAEGDLEPTLGSGSRTRLRQEITIENLSQLWLPAAYQPESVTDSAHARYHDESGTLIVDNGYVNSDGLSYVVESVLPEFDRARLSTATNDNVDRDFMARYTELPPRWADQAPTLARDIVEQAGATTDYEKALALQDHFRAVENGFIYNLDAKVTGHSGNAIDSFLRNKEGFCEQFSAAYASMARSLGIPARVAVGFTWGNKDPSDPQLFHVRGEHAHAWPEVYLGEYGWVAFEPTPGRGAPAAAAWTGIQPAQAVEAAPGPRSTAPDSSIAPPVTVPGPGSTSTTTGPDDGIDLNDPGRPDPLQLVDDGGSPVLVVFALTLVATVILAALYLVWVFMWLSRARERRRNRAQSPNDWVRVAWAEAIDDLALVNAIPMPAETHNEFADRAGRVLPDAHAGMAELAEALDASLYGGEIQDESVRHRATAAADAIRQVVEQVVPRTRRLLTQINPAWVIRRARIPAAHSATSTHIAGT